MTEHDLILDKTHALTAEEISDYINEPGRKLWNELISFLQDRFRVNPKITYSVCSGKPGWNVKYQKSGKSLCTLYPEKDGFVALVVVKLDLLPVIEGLQAQLDAEIIDIVRQATPFNGTLWLMVPVCRETTLTGVKELLLLKAKA